MAEDVKDEMAWVYGHGDDPWKYEVESRHWLTLALAQQYWQGGILAELPCAEGVLAQRLISQLQPTPRLFHSIDLMPVAVARAEKRLRSYCGPGKLQTSVDVQVHDLREGFPEWFVDMMIIHDVLPMLPKERAIQVIVEASQRVLPGGTLMISSWTSPDYYEDPHFGPVEIEGFELEQTLSWTGHARDLQGKRYPAAAQYRMYKRVVKTSACQ